MKPDQKHKGHVTDFKIIDNFQAKYVSCSLNHSILVKSSLKKEEDGLPYAWGDNSYYRFGKQDKKDKKQPKLNEEQGNLEDSMQRI